MGKDDFFLDVFERRIDDYNANLARCRAEFSESAVHDLRVSTRRLLAVLQILRSIDPQRKLKRLRGALKAQLDGFDELRDTQVMLGGIAQHIASLPGLAPFQAYLQKREKRLLREAEARVRAMKLKDTQRRLLNLRQVALPDDLSERMLTALDEAYGLVMERYAGIDPARPASIHSVRVAFKKFRYALECASPLLTEFPQKQFKRMQATQTLMGNIQDAQVFLQALDVFARKHPEFDLVDVQRAAQEYFDQSILTFLTASPELADFWRSSATATFPWLGDFQPKEQL